MMRRLRELMNTPFARPPGRKSIWARFAPEWCALAVGIFFLGVFGLWPARTVTAHLLAAAPAAYGLAGIILFVLPLVQGAWAWAPEKTRDTMPALVMTPLDHRAVVWGRFWHIVLPWLRFFGCLLPIYVLGASHQELVREIGRSDGWEMGMLCSFAPKPLAVAMGWIVSNGMGDELAFSLKAHGFLALRILNDFAIFFLIIGTAYFFSVLCRTPTRALLAALAAIILFMASFGALDIWWLVLAGKLRVHESTFSVVGATIACSLILVRLAVPLFLIAWAARRFDAWLPDEKPGP